MNRNVRIVLVFAFLSKFAWALWNGGAQMPAFIFMVSGNSNAAVGIFETIQGLAQLAIAIPSGILADKWRRDGVLRLSMIANLFAILFILLAVWFHQKLTLLGMGMGTWGIASALNDGPLEAIFADSTPTGRRSNIFATKFALMMAGSSSGGLLGALIYWCEGNSWSLRHLQIVISTGLIMGIVPAILQAYLRDEDGLINRAENVTILNSSQLSELRWSPSIRYQLSLVPYFLAFCDLLTALGAGALIKFFGLYFIQEFKMKPFNVSLLLALTPMVISASSLVAAHSAHRFGRVNTILVYHITGTILLFIFAHIRSLAWSIPIFVIRGAIMNSFKPLKRSLLMDVIEKRRRGCWNSLESLTRFSWSGSAALGGLALDRWGYRYTFIATACLYVIASIPLIALCMMRIELKIQAQTENTPLLDESRYLPHVSASTQLAHN